MLLLSLAAASYAPQPILSVVTLPAASRAATNERLQLSRSLLCCQQY